MARNASIYRCKNIIAGLDVDVANFLKIFENTKSIRFEGFAQIWREQKYDCFFMYREMKEFKLFIDETFKYLVKTFVLVPTMTEKAGILYFIYGFYFRQPMENKTKIRVTQSQFEELISMMEKAQSDDHYDVCYVFWSLFHNDAFIFVYRHDFNDINQLHELNSGSNETPNILEQIISEEQIDQLALLHEKYASSKSVQESTEVKNLRLCNHDFIADFKKSLAELKQKREDPQNIARPSTEDFEQLNIRTEIKNRQLSKPLPPTKIARCLQK